jgi:arginine repressor
MVDRAQKLALGAVNLIATLLDSLRREAFAWIQGGDTTFIVLLVGVAMLLLVMVVVPTRRRY